MKKKGYNFFNLVNSKYVSALDPSKSNRLEFEQRVTPSEFQTRIINHSGSDLILPGGRGGGKSYGTALRIIKRVKTLGIDYQGLFFRKTMKGVRDFKKVTQIVFPLKYPGSKLNSADNVWKFPNGATLELDQLETMSDYEKFQGRSFTDISADEAAQYASPDLIDLMFSNLRARSGVQVSFTLIANPGNAGHGWFFERYVQGRTPGVPYLEPATERLCTTYPSTYKDNGAINQDEYLKSLTSATANDADLRKAYILGDWNIARGAFFGSVLDKSRSQVPPVQSLLGGWSVFLSMDYGTAAPCAIYLMAESPGGFVNGLWFPPNSILVFGELYLAQDKNNGKGLGLTIPEQASRIKEFCAYYGHNALSSANVADDACFADDGRSSIADEFKANGVAFSRAHKKDRLSGWESVRTLLRQAGSPDVPGLYVTADCTYFWKIFPTIPRDPKKLWDVDTKSNDHIGDAIRYGVISRKGQDSEYIPTNNGIDMQANGSNGFAIDIGW
jgi:phage terminase large subunit